MNTKPSTITIGIDLGNRRHPQALIAMGVGMHSPWTSRYLKVLGHPVLVANPHKLRAIDQNHRMSDRRDAEMLARIARTDECLLHLVDHVSEDLQRDLLQIKLRDNLVRQRVDIISSVRFTLKSLGIALRSPNTARFSRHTRKALAAEQPVVLCLVEPSLQVLDSMRAWEIARDPQCFQSRAIGS